MHDPNLEREQWFAHFKKQLREAMATATTHAVAENWTAYEATQISIRSIIAAIKRRRRLGN